MNRRDREARRSVWLFVMAPLPLASAAALGRPGAGGALLLGLLLAAAGVFVLARGAE